jgi:hypothetical protein
LSVAETMEGVIDFYSGPEFNGPRASTAQFNFDQTERDQRADFLRALNTLQNVDIARRELKEIVDNRKGNPRREADRRIQTAFDEIDDPIDVLNEGGIFGPAVTHLVCGAQSHCPGAAQQRWRSASGAGAAGDCQAQRGAARRVAATMS